MLERLNFFIPGSLADLEVLHHLGLALASGFTSVGSLEQAVIPKKYPRRFAAELPIVVDQHHDHEVGARNSGEQITRMTSWVQDQEGQQVWQCDQAYRRPSQSSNTIEFRRGLWLHGKPSEDSLTASRTGGDVRRIMLPINEMLATHWDLEARQGVSQWPSHQSRIVHAACSQCW